jgi:hypothetical protein
MIIGKIKKINKVKKFDRVYDIETKNHNFFANNMLVHNSHMVSDISYSSKIRPMLTAHKHYQLIEIGVAMYKGHFHNDFKDTKFVTCVADWLHSPRLKESGIFTYDKIITHEGKILYDGFEYPKGTMELMPPDALRKYFPDRPDLITGTGGVSSLDFMMQYELQWLDDVNLFLNEKQQRALCSGTHRILDRPIANSIFTFGLDTNGGFVNQNTLEQDFTSLSIFHLLGGKLLRVYGQQWKGDPILQYDEILEVLKLFGTKYGIIDYSHLAEMFIPMLKRDGIRCEGVQWGKSCPESHKSYKVTMYENFLARLNLGQIKYPNMDDLEEKNKSMSKDLIENFREGFFQWCALQRTASKKSDNVFIEAPTGGHDDLCASDIMSVWAVNNVNAQLAAGTPTKFPFIVSKSGVMLSGNNNNNKGGGGF